MIKKIKIPIFFGTLVLFQNYDIKKACKIANFDYDPNNTFDGYSGTNTDRDGHFGYIIIFDKCDASIISHEAVHIAHRILNRNGIEKDEELIAYLTGWITAQCCKYLNVTNK